MSGSIVSLSPMAQRAKKKRRRKRRGTQTGAIDRRGPRGRPRTREEARARARSRGKKSPARPVDRRDLPPTWASAAKRGALGAVVFFALIVLLFKQPVASAIVLSVLMVAMYVPLGYYVDQFFYRRRMRQQG